ncbi:spermidine synthase [Aciduliprofundum sp. MAR08-339]|uniref:polyamine aminopropyltransferase n=1 Tax=Aciduliprofundum sp. (strain MAR08-339) TaxID=673860 RepID=UPI0002A49579|nr:spermidine synthase [Aciduliprofundum sp. MAR08-339]
MELWFSEMHTDNVKLGFRIRREIEHVRSPYQDIHIFETYDYGKLLVIDGTVQLTERDEFVYHEMIVHPPMLTHPDPKRILIIGGGDGGSAREVLKHDPDEVHVVEIDEEVVRLSRKHLPFVARSYDDPRVHIHIEDGIEFAKREKNFDVIIIDSTDPVGPAEKLFSGEFYRYLRNTLAPGGIISQQCGTPVYHPEEVCNVHALLSREFRYVRLYFAYIPTYPSGMWAFSIASDEPIRIRRKMDFPTRYFNEEIYSSSMVLPNFVKEKCHQE